MLLPTQVTQFSAISSIVVQFSLSMEISQTKIDNSTFVFEQNSDEWPRELNFEEKISIGLLDTFIETNMFTLI